MHLPFDHSTACSMVISALVVGLDSGKMSGDSHPSHSASTVSLWKDCGDPVSPKRALGLTCLMMSTRLAMLGVPSVRANCVFHSFSLSPRVVVIRPLESTM